MIAGSSVRVRLLATVVLAVGAVVAAGASNVRYHAVLKKSWPASHDTVATSPDSLKFWFSEKVEMSLTKIALSAAGSSKMLTQPGYLSGNDDSPIVVAVKEKLPAGSYTVNWTVAGKDGHPSKGTYDFVVKAGK